MDNTYRCPECGAELLPVCYWCGEAVEKDDLPTIENHMRRCPQRPKGIIAEHEEEFANLEAQLALVAEALRTCASADEWKDCENLINASYSPVGFARAVCKDLLDGLSATPKVLYRERGCIQHDYWRANKQKPMTVVFLPADQFIIDAAQHIHADRQGVDVLVLASEQGQCLPEARQQGNTEQCQGHPEQGQESEQPS